MDSCNRADHATRLVHSLILPMTVDPIVCGISTGSVVVPARGFLGIPRARYSSDPHPLRGLALPTHIGWKPHDS